MTRWQRIVGFVNEAVDGMAKLVQSIRGTGVAQVLEEEC